MPTPPAITPSALHRVLDQSRLALLVAVLQKHGHIALGNEDIFVNVVGGLKIAETGSDLPTLLAVVSSFRERACSANAIAFGEIGLAGEVRPIKFGTERITEAAKQGFTKAIVPAANKPKSAGGEIEVVAVATLAEALDAAFDS